MPPPEHATAMSRRKPMNIREAQAIATLLIGPRGGVRIRRDRGACEYVVFELIAIGDAREYGVSLNGWRKALHDAGLFWE